MLRYERLECANIDYQFYVSALREELPSIDDALQYKRQGDTRGWIRTASVWCYVLAQMTHLQYKLPFGKIMPHIEKGVIVAVEYFYGKWRDNYDFHPKTIEWLGKSYPNPNYVVYNRDDCRKELYWEDEFQDGVLCALWINDEKSLTGIAEFLDDDLIDHGKYDCSEIDARFLVLLGKFLRGESLQTNSHIVEIIHDKSRRRPKLLLDVIESIELKSSEKFGDALTKYVTYYVKNEFKPEETSPLDCVSKMASILWETARYKGLSLPSLPEEIMDRIVTRESIGLTS